MRCQWKTTVQNWQKYHVTSDTVISIFGVCDPNFGSPDHITTAMCRQKKSSSNVGRFLYRKCFKWFWGQKFFSTAEGERWVWQQNELKRFSFEIR